MPPSPAPPSPLPSNPVPPRSTHRASSKAGTDPGPSRVGVLGMLPYLLVLAVVAVGLAIAFHGSRFAGRGTALIGGALLVAALTRLALPQRASGLLASRGKAADVLAFAVLGGSVLTIALVLPLSRPGKTRYLDIKQFARADLPGAIRRHNPTE